jgi:hypothetical protein
VYSEVWGFRSAGVAVDCRDETFRRDTTSQNTSYIPSRVLYLIGVFPVQRGRVCWKWKWTLDGLWASTWRPVPSLASTLPCAPSWASKFRVVRAYNSLSVPDTVSIAERAPAAPGEGGGFVPKLGRMVFLFRGLCRPTRRGTGGLSGRGFRLPPRKSVPESMRPGWLRCGRYLQSSTQPSSIRGAGKCVKAIRGNSVKCKCQVKIEITMYFMCSKSCDRIEASY